MQKPGVPFLTEPEIDAAARALDAWFTSQDIDMGNAASIMCELQARTMLEVTRQEWDLARGLNAFLRTLTTRLANNMEKS